VRLAVAGAFALWAGHPVAIDCGRPPAADAGRPPVAGLDGRLQKIATSFDVPVRSPETVDEQLQAIVSTDAAAEAELTPAVAGAGGSIPDRALEGLFLIRALYGRGLVAAI